MTNSFIVIKQYVVWLQTSCR